MEVYIVVFVCMATKAVGAFSIMNGSEHECFLAAFRKCISQRGQLRTVRSENGTNKEGAPKVLKEASIRN